MEVLQLDGNLELVYFSAEMVLLSLNEMGSVDSTSGGLNSARGGLNRS
jgi:hypothetical protein